MHNYYIEFTPPGQNIFRLPILAIDKFDAERITFELAIVLHAHAVANYNGSSSYETDDHLELSLEWS